MSVAGQPLLSAQPGAVQAAEPEIETQPQLDEGDPAHDWLCAWCLNRVANDKDRLSFGGKSEFSFRNPEGRRFHIIIFSRTLACHDVGVPTYEYTWFPGHAWSYCLCGRCRMHLGWFYAGPTSFVGLIRDRIVRASLIRN
jgi:hypothetical protein